MTIETKIAKNGSKRYYVRENGKRTVIAWYDVINKIEDVFNGELVITNDAGETFTRTYISSAAVSFVDSNGNLYQFSVRKLSEELGDFAENNMSKHLYASAEKIRNIEFEAATVEAAISDEAFNAAVDAEIENAKNNVSTETNAAVVNDNVVEVTEVNAEANADEVKVEDENAAEVAESLNVENAEVTAINWCHRTIERASVSVEQAVKIINRLAFTPTEFKFANVTVSNDRKIEYRHFDGLDSEGEINNFAIAEIVINGKLEIVRFYNFYREITVDMQIGNLNYRYEPIRGGIEIIDTPDDNKTLAEADAEVVNEIAISDEAFNAAIECEVTAANINKFNSNEYYRVESAYRPANVFWHEFDKEITDTKEFATLEEAVKFARVTRDIFKKDDDRDDLTRPRFVIAKVYFVQEHSIVGRYTRKKYTLHFDGREYTDYSESIRNVLAKLDDDDNPDTPDKPNTGKREKKFVANVYRESESGNRVVKSKTFDSAAAAADWIINYTNEHRGYRVVEGTEIREVGTPIAYKLTERDIEIANGTIDAGEQITNQLAELPADPNENNFAAARYVTSVVFTQCGQKKSLPQSIVSIRSTDFARAEKAKAIMESVLNTDTVDVVETPHISLYPADNKLDKVTTVYYAAELDGSEEEDDDKNIFAALPEVSELADVSDEGEISQDDLIDKWNFKLSDCEFRRGIHRISFKHQQRTVCGTFKPIFGFSIYWSTRINKYAVKVDGNCFAGTYSTPAQIERLIAEFEGAIKRGDTEFTFPPAESVITFKPPTPDKVQITPIYGKTPRRVLRANLLKIAKRQQATFGLLVRPNK